MRLVGGVHDIVSSKMAAEPSTPSTAGRDGARDTLACGLLETALGNHVDLIGEGDNHVLV